MVDDDEDRSAQMTIHAELSLAEPNRKSAYPSSRPSTKSRPGGNYAD